MKNSTKAKILAGGLGLAALLAPIACDNGTTSDTKCECPNGTIHTEPNTNCCNEADCTCVIRYNAAFDGKAITIDDHSRQLSLDKLNEIKDTLSGYSAPSSEIAGIKSLLSQIVVEKTSAYTNFKLVNNQIYLNVDAASIGGATGLALAQIVIDNGITVNNFSPYPRLANGIGGNAGGARRQILPGRPQSGLVTQGDRYARHPHSIVKILG